MSLVGTPTTAELKPCSIEKSHVLVKAIFLNYTLAYKLNRVLTLSML